MTQDYTGRVNGPTILLSSGRYFDVEQPLNPPPTITDIAWGLAHECRWSGQNVQKSSGRHCFYSVGQHCVIIVNKLEIYHEAEEPVKREILFAALMHELGEFVWRDIGGPLKVLVPDYKFQEKKLASILETYFGVSRSWSEIIKSFDKRMMATERRDLMNWNPDHYWSYLGDAQPFEEVIEPWEPEVAAINFLKLFTHLAPPEVVAREEL